MQKKINYYGNVYTGRKYICKGLLILSYSKFVPRKFNIYLEKDYDRELSQLKNEIDTLKPLIIETPYDKIFITSRGLNKTFQFGSSKVSTLLGEIDKILLVHYLPFKTDDSRDLQNINVNIKFSDINYLNKNKNYSHNDLIKNLCNIEKISDKSKISVKSLFRGFSYNLWADYELKNKDISIVSTYNNFSFQFDNKGDTEKIIDSIIDKTNILTRIIRFLTNQKNNYVCINLSRYYSDYAEEVKYYNNHQLETSFDNAHSVKHYEFIALLDSITQKYSDFNEKTEHVFDVVITRMSKLNFKVDLSILISLVHVTLVNLIKYYRDGNFFKLDNKEKVLELFHGIGLICSEIELDNIVRLNKYRNNLFKNIVMNFDYNSDYFISLNTALDFIFELIARMLDLTYYDKTNFIKIMNEQYRFEVIDINKNYNEDNKYSNFINLESPDNSITTEVKL